MIVMAVLGLIFQFEVPLVALLLSPSDSFAFPQNDGPVFFSRSDPRVESCDQSGRQARRQGGG